MTARLGDRRPAEAPPSTLVDLTNSESDVSVSTLDMSQTPPCQEDVLAESEASQAGSEQATQVSDHCVGHCVDHCVCMAAASAVGAGTCGVGVAGRCSQSAPGHVSMAATASSANAAGCTVLSSAGRITAAEGTTGSYLKSWPGMLPAPPHAHDAALLTRAQGAIEAGDVERLKGAARELINEVRHLGIRLQHGGKLKATLSSPNTLFEELSRLLQIPTKEIRRACSLAVLDDAHFEGHLFRFVQGEKLHYSNAEYARKVMEPDWQASRMDLHVLAHTTLLKHRVVVLTPDNGSVRYHHFTPAGSMADAPCLWLVSCSHGRWYSIKIGNEVAFTAVPANVEAAVAAVAEHGKLLRSDPLENAVSRYCVALRQQSLQGALPSLLLLERAHKLPCPVVIMQQDSKAGKLSLITSATVPEGDDASQRVYLLYTKGPDGAGAGHYDAFHIKPAGSSTPRYRLSAEEARPEALELAASGATSPTGVCLQRISGLGGLCLFRCISTAFNISREEQLAVAFSQALALLQLTDPDERSTWANTLLDGLRAPKSKSALPSATLLNIPAGTSFPKEWDVVSVRRSRAKTIVTVATDDALHALLSSSFRLQKSWLTVEESETKAKGDKNQQPAQRIALHGAPRRLTLEKLKERDGWQRAAAIICHVTETGHFHQVTMPNKEAEKLLASSPSHRRGWRVEAWKQRGAASKKASDAVKGNAAAQAASALKAAQNSAPARQKQQAVDEKKLATASSAAASTASHSHANSGASAAATAQQPSSTVAESRDKEMHELREAIRNISEGLAELNKKFLPSQQEEQSQETSNGGDGRPPYGYAPPFPSFHSGEPSPPFPLPFPPPWFPPPPSHVPHFSFGQPYRQQQQQYQRTNSGPSMRVDHFLRGNPQQQPWGWPPGHGGGGPPNGHGWYGHNPAYGPWQPSGAGASAGRPPRW